MITSFLFRFNPIVSTAVVKTDEESPNEIEDNESDITTNDDPRSTTSTQDTTTTTDSSDVYPGEYSVR